MFLYIIEYDYTLNWVEEVCIIKQAKFFNIIKQAKVIRNYSGEEINRRFYEKEFLKTNQTEIEVKKLIKRKAHKVYVK